MNYPRLPSVFGPDHDMNALTDVIAGQIEQLARDAMAGKLPVSGSSRAGAPRLEDASTDLACEIVDAVARRLTAPAN